MQAVLDRLFRPSSGSSREGSGRKFDRRALHSSVRGARASGAPEGWGSQAHPHCGLQCSAVRRRQFSCECSKPWAGCPVQYRCFESDDARSAARPQVAGARVRRCSSAYCNPFNHFGGHGLDGGAEDQLGSQGGTRNIGACALDVGDRVAPQPRFSRSRLAFGKSTADRAGQLASQSNGRNGFKLAGSLEKGGAGQPGPPTQVTAIDCGSFRKGQGARGE